MRTLPQVRLAGVEDLPALLALHAELVEAENHGALRRRVRSAERNQPAGPDPMLQRYEAAFVTPGRRVLIAEVAGNAVGTALLTVEPASILDPEPAVVITHMVVAGRARRQGTGSALLAAAAGVAEEEGTATVVVTCRSADREANRYFARLGFTPLTIRRQVATGVLRRRLSLAAAPTEPAAFAGGHVENGSLALAYAVDRPVHDTGSLPLLRAVDPETSREVRRQLLRRRSR